MKRIISFMVICVFVLSACGFKGTNQQNEDNKSETKAPTTQQNNKSETKETNIDEVELQEFASSLYEANKRSDIEHFEELTTDNVKSVINRQFQGANTENSKDYEKSVSNTKIYQSLDDKNRYIVTLETKDTDHKKKDITWLQKTIEFKIKGGKIDEFQEIGSREIYDEQD